MLGEIIMINNKMLTKVTIDTDDIWEGQLELTEDNCIEFMQQPVGGNQYKYKSMILTIGGIN